MSAEEFVSWQAWLRRNPRGFHWDNWVQATLARELNRLLPRGKRDRMPKLEEFLYKPPEPLMVGRARAEAKRKKVK